LSSIGGFKENQLVVQLLDAQYYLYVTEDVTQENPVEKVIGFKQQRRRKQIALEQILFRLL
jgi:hypothetical protein